MRDTLRSKSAVSQRDIIRVVRLLILDLQYDKLATMQPWSMSPVGGWVGGGRGWTLLARIRSVFQTTFLVRGGSPSELRAGVIYWGFILAVDVLVDLRKFFRQRSFTAPECQRSSMAHALLLAFGVCYYLGLNSEQRRRFVEITRRHLEERMLTGVFFGGNRFAG